MKVEVHVHLYRFRLKEHTAKTRTTREEKHPPQGSLFHSRPEDKHPAWKEGGFKRVFAEVVITDEQENQSSFQNASGGVAVMKTQLITQQVGS